jgi:diguanylate cyclase (GGDEF)-like protein/PAS domain S-box-containing protein
MENPSNSTPYASILVADDDPMVRLLARESLRHADFEVSEAANGQEALTRFDQLRPDIVMLDVRMPVMDGFSACSRLRDHPAGKLTPILMVTGLDDVDSINRAYEAGATDFATKPINWLILGHRLRYMLRASRSIEALHRSEMKNRALLDAVPDLMLRANRHGELLEFKETKGLGLPSLVAGCMGRKLYEVLPVEVAHQVIKSADIALATGEAETLEYVQVTAGSRRDCEARIVSCGQDEILVMVRDITARKRSEKALRESEERYALALQGANDGLWDWDLRVNEIHFSNRWKSMLGYGEDEVGNRPEEWLDRIHRDDADRVRMEINTHREGKGPHFQSEYRIMCKDGSYRWMLSRGIALADSRGNSYRMAGSQTDITEGKRVAEQLLQEAFYDGLTKLPNRALFMDRLNHAVQRGGRMRGCFAVLFIDLDRFKFINDSLGHLAGDHLLAETAERINHFIRPADTFARLGGDEFVILLEDIKGLENVTAVAERIQNVFRIPFSLDDREVFVTASIGIALNSGEYMRPQDMLRDADIAMYRAKEGEPGSWVIFDPSMHTSAVKVLELQNDLRRALDCHEFFLAYQPIVDIHAGRVASLEALIRWTHPTRGVVTPDSFISLAEETGLILPIGEWVLDTVCRQMRKWHDGGLMVRVAVNLSARQLRDSSLADTISRFLKQSKVEPEWLEIEITESSIMGDWEVSGATLSRLQALGVRLSLDDFGTGYSSLSYLNKLPVTKLKIDRSFVARMAPEAERHGIIKTILDLADSLKMEVVAEGVETMEQLAQLRDMKCSLIQGYVFSKPLDQTSVEAYLRSFQISDNLRLKGCYSPP